MQFLVGNSRVLISKDSLGRCLKGDGISCIIAFELEAFGTNGIRAPKKIESNKENLLQINWVSV